MNTLMLLCAALGVTTTAATTRPADKAPAGVPALHVDRFLWAIAQVESGGNPRAVGSLGERSRYQFTAATWRQHTPQSFERAGTDGALADAVARRHLAWLRAQLSLMGEVETPQLLAAAWRYGLKFAHITQHGESVQRVVNLYVAAGKEAGV